MSIRLFFAVACLTCMAFVTLSNHATAQLREQMRRTGMPLELFSSRGPNRQVDLLLLNGIYAQYENDVVNNYGGGPRGKHGLVFIKPGRVVCSDPQFGTDVGRAIFGGDVRLSKFLPTVTMHLQDVQFIATRFVRQDGYPDYRAIANHLCGQIASGDARAMVVGRDSCEVTGASMPIPRESSQGESWISENMTWRAKANVNLATGETLTSTNRFSSNRGRLVVTTRIILETKGGTRTETAPIFESRFIPVGQLRVSVGGRSFLIGNWQQGDPLPNQSRGDLLSLMAVDSPLYSRLARIHVDAVAGLYATEEGRLDDYNAFFAEILE